MSTRILFADDSVTAQNMGKRILTEAGYEVVAVSNGAAAVKKIAEQKPDIIILDLYMPGYSGLEVCEKIRGSMATLKTPVLLTVGKMEPYRPEDANRVRADGVIVKPFEASDLLAIIKKFEERIVPPPPPLAQQADAAELDEAAMQELSIGTSARTPISPQPTLDVPDHMASSSAFADLLGMESPEPGAASLRPSAPDERAAVSATSRAGPEYDLPTSWRREEEPVRTEIELPHSASSVEPPQHDVQVFEGVKTHSETADGDETDVAPPPASSHPLQIPVYQESAEAADTHEMMPTAVPPIREIEIPREPFLQETAAETTRNTLATDTEAGLITTLQPEQPLRANLVAAEMAPVDADLSASRTIPLDVPVDGSQEALATQVPQHETGVSDADFDARVTAALAAYHQTDSRPTSDSTAPAHDKKEAQELHDVQTEPPVPFGASSPMAEENMPFSSIASEHAVLRDQSISEFEYQPPIGVSIREARLPESFSSPPVAGSSPIADQPAPQAGPIEASPSHVPFAGDVERSEVEVGVAAASESLAEAAAAGTHGNRDTIAQAVHRVMERLKPELVEEIIRELKSKE